MPIYEVTAAHWDGESDATDDRVIWVEALDAQSVTTSLSEGLGARFWGEVSGADEADANFDLLDPAQHAAFREKLEWFRDNLPEVGDGQGH